MRKLLLYHLFAVTFQIMLFEPLKAQHEFIEEKGFSNRIGSPLEVKVDEQNNSLIFNVFNKSFFSYDLEIHFSQFDNLSPRILDKQMIINRGTNRLFTLKIVDITKSVQVKISRNLRNIMTTRPIPSNVSSKY